ncbi:hypothetical protein ACSVIJ_05250 [Pseudomonas sp. NCHU5208]|uniref:hypothetical protein n=1 Tax=unclassified Pseudomonas TaxID=196821 RepID=UPI003F96C443
MTDIRRYTFPSGDGNTTSEYILSSDYDKLAFENRKLQKSISLLRQFNIESLKRHNCQMSAENIEQDFLIWLITKTLPSVKVLFATNSSLVLPPRVVDALNYLDSVGQPGSQT